MLCGALLASACAGTGAGSSPADAAAAHDVGVLEDSTQAAADVGDGAAPDAPASDAAGSDAAGSDAAGSDAAGSDAATADDSGPPRCVATPVADYCSDVPAMSIHPVIDGVVDCDLPLRTVTPVGWSGTDPIPAGISARYAIGWRPEGLYVFVEVTDATREPAGAMDDSFCGDAVELYVDSDAMYRAPPEYDDPGSRQFVVVAPANDTTPSTRGVVYRYPLMVGPWASTRFGAYPRAGGYTVEAIIGPTDLGMPTAGWTPAAGQRLGFDLAVNVGGPRGKAWCSARLGQYFLHLAPSPVRCDGRPYCDVLAFCTPQLR